MYSNFTPPTFLLENIEQWKNYLETEGYVVISNILHSNEILEAFNLFQKDWTTVSPNFNFEDTNTFNIQYTPIMYGKGMALFNGFGQSDFMWYLRTREQIKTIFKNIHNCEELVTSMDGFSVYVSGDQKTKSWFHIDQNPTNNLSSFQGAYNLLRVCENSAGFVVIPKSHNTFKPNVKHNKDWIMLDQNEISLFSPVKLLIPENCFTIWNSKLIHCNTGISEKKQKV